MLRDADKRKKYDTLGANWKNGQDFSPPPGWEGSFQFGGGGGGAFSDFFEALFGNLGGFTTMEGQPFRGRSLRRRGRDLESKIELTLDELAAGGKKRVEFEVLSRGPDGRARRSRKSLEVTIPKGVTQGSRIRLAGQGEAGSGGGPPDLTWRSTSGDPASRSRGRTSARPWTSPLTRPSAGASRSPSWAVR